MNIANAFVLGYGNAMKSETLGVRIKQETKAALEKAAAEDMRSMSSLIEKILTEWLRDRGLLPPKNF